MTKIVCIAPMQEGQTLVEMVEALNRRHQKTFGSFVTVFTHDNFMTAVAFEIDGNGTFSQRIDDTMGHFSNRILRVAEERGLAIYHSWDDAIQRTLKAELKAELEGHGYHVVELDYYPFI